jgi:hypothetical protein
MGINEVYFKYANCMYYNVWNFAACEILNSLLRDVVDIRLNDPFRLQDVGKQELTYYVKEYLGLDLAKCAQLEKVDSATLNEAFMARFSANLRDIARPLEKAIEEAARADPIRIRDGFKKIQDDFTIWYRNKKLDPIIKAVEQLINGD